VESPSLLSVITSHPVSTRRDLFLCSLQISKVAFSTSCVLLFFPSGTMAERGFGPIT